MNLLSAENLSKSYGDSPLFKNLTFGVNKGQRVALVGANGSGKTTLLSILMGDTLPDTGNVSLRREISVGYLPQQPVFQKGQTVADYVFAGGDNPALQAIRDYELALTEPGTPRLSAAMERVDALGAWDYETETKHILARLGIRNFDQQVSTLSGGQQKRVAMARLFVSRPDLVIMDEPTNHLDLGMIEWLEEYLTRSTMSLLIVTHDRYFLDAVCNEVLELNQGQMHRHQGNYSYYVEQRALRETLEDAEVEKAKNLMRKELEWMRRQPKARGTKSQARINSFYELEEKAGRKRREQNLELGIGATRQGSKIMEIEYVTKAYEGRTLIKDFTYTFQKMDRIGIVGNNGSGKTTLLEMLVGHLKPDSGRVRPGETTVVGYYTQKGPQFDPTMRVIDVIKEVAEVIELADGSEIAASQFLTRFGFEPSRQFTPVGKLSGGEKRRLHLMRVLVLRPNLLILDEPTNDLDIPTLNVLEEYLAGFPGSLVIVTHDRFFLDRLVDHLWVFEGNGKLRDFPGNYTDYREEVSAKLPDTSARSKAARFDAPDALDAAALTPMAPTAAPAPPKRKLSYKEQKELEGLEAELAQLETEKTTHTEELSRGTATHTRLMELGERLKAIEQALDEKGMRWLELSE